MQADLTDRSVREQEDSNMADMGDITDKFTEVINTVTDKAREYGEVARLHALIKAEEAKKQEYYYKLGKKYYELYKDAPASDLSEMMNKLIAADEKIADYKDDLKAATAKEPESSECSEEPAAPFAEDAGGSETVPEDTHEDPGESSQESWD